MAVLPRIFLISVGILQARHLDQDAVGALSLDQRLDGAELVDAAFDDLDRLLDGLADALGDRGLRHRQADQAAAGVGHVQAALTVRSHEPAKRLRQLAQFGERVLQVGVLDTDLDVVGTRGKTGVADLGFAQRAADIIPDLIEFLLPHVIGIDLEQQVASRPAGRGRARDGAAPMPARS